MVMTSDNGKKNDKEEKEESVFSTSSAKNFVDNFGRVVREKSDFLAKIFGNLVVQLGVTYYSAYKLSPVRSVHEIIPFLQNMKYSDFTQSIIDIAILFIYPLLIFFFIHRTSNVFLQLPLFFAYSYFVGRIIGMLPGIRNSSITLNIFKIIGTIFVAMFSLGIVSLLSGIEFGKNTVLGMIAALILYIVFSVFASGSAADSWISYVLYFVGIIMISAFIFIDTNMILQDKYQTKKTFVEASLRYYLDIIALFRILRGRRKRR